MTRWRNGEEQVTHLIEQRNLQRVVADSETVASLLASARRHVESARRTADSDPEAAYSLAYDAARKSATALLAHQGLRPTTIGGHLVVVDVMRAQFPGLPGLTSLDRLRRRRNQGEYPDPKGYDPIVAAEAKEVIEVAVKCVSSAALRPGAPSCSSRWRSRARPRRRCRCRGGTSGGTTRAAPRPPRTAAAAAPRRAQTRPDAPARELGEHGVKRRHGR